MATSLEIRLCALISEDPKEANLMLAHELINGLEEIDNPLESVATILRFIEEHPETHFGDPGPLVHFVERYYKKGYELLLIQSIERNPSINLISMLNRILNALTNDRKESYLEILEASRQRHISNIPITEEINRIIKRHRSV